MDNFLKLKLLNKNFPPYIWAWFHKYKHHEEITSDESITIENTYGQKFSKFDIFGNTEQAQYEGRNKIPMSLFNTMVSQGSNNSYDSTNHRITYSSDNTSFSGYYKVLQNLVVDTTYTLSFDIRGTAGKKVLLGWDGTPQTYTLKANYERVSYNYTATVEAKPIIFFSQTTVNGGLGTNEYMEFDNVMLTTNGSSDYEIYVGGTASPNPSYPQTINNVTGDNTIIVSNEDGTEYQEVTFPLGTSKMYDDDYLADDGIHHVMGEVILDGSNDENWSFVGSYNRFQILVDNFVSPEPTIIANIICNKLIATTKNNIAFENNKISGADANQNRIIIRIDNTITSVAELRAWLSNNPITVQYELAQEVIEPYTTAQQTAWNDIKALYTYLDYTLITQTNDDLPFILKVIVN